jgi:hypothetical protein
MKHIMPELAYTHSMELQPSLEPKQTPYIGSCTNIPATAERGKPSHIQDLCIDGARADRFDWPAAPRLTLGTWMAGE